MWCNLLILFNAYRETEDPLEPQDNPETLGLDFQEPRCVSKEIGKDDDYFELLF